MTADASEVAVIVLGVSGRVGRELLPVLADGKRTVIGVVRDQKSDVMRPNLHWMQVDVTERDVWQRSLLALSGIASIYRRTIVVDLVLDRRTVSAMRQSIADTTEYTRKLIDKIAERGATPLLVAASTTAILAPWPYQTPYGSAKRQQAKIYATLPSSQILLLPSLSPEGKNSTAWAYKKAALAIAHVVGAVAESANPPANLWLPDVRPSSSIDRPLTERFVKAITAQLRCFGQRDDPWAHRRTAHARLDLTPRALRTRVDHHLVPPRLATAFARRAGLRVEHMPTRQALHEGLCTP